MSAVIQSKQKILYTARVRTDGDRNGGVSRSDDGRIELKHTPPGHAGAGTNPEQLLAAGWAACFQAAMVIAAREKRVSLPSPTSVDAEVDLVHGDDGYSLRARFVVSVPGVERAVALALIERADETCPYSKAMHATVPLELKLA